VCSVSVQDHLLPEEYVVTMREHMLDKCPISSYDEVRHIIQEDLGAPPEQLFSQFSEVPIASASLAQVWLQAVCRPREAAGGCEMDRTRHCTRRLAVGWTLRVIAGSVVTGCVLSRVLGCKQQWGVWP